MATLFTTENFGMWTSRFFGAGLARLGRAGAALTVLGAGLGLGACSNILDVDYPGRIPAGQIDNPTLAPVLVNSVIGDFECAYNNYFAGSSIHSDEFESANSNGELAGWGERGVTSNDDDYAVGGCENGRITGSGNSSAFGIWVPMQTARYQAEDVYTRLNGWTDAQVPSRTSLLATVRAYGGYVYALMGETFCAVSFDKGSRQEPSAALALAEQRLAEAITLAQQAGNTGILNLARVGLARTKIDLKKWSEAQTLAAQVPEGFEKFADRGTENDRRSNKLYYFATVQAAYVVADAYRAIGTVDPRVQVADAHKGAFNPTIELWVQLKYRAMADPIRLASYREAQLLLAEAKARQGDVPGALAILNARRAQVGLGALTAGSPPEAVSAVIEERRRELVFEGAHRLNDLLRSGTPWKVGANTYTGRPYGSTTCFPYPTKEASGA